MAYIVKPITWNNATCISRDKCKMALSASVLKAVRTLLLSSLNFHLITFSVFAYWNSTKATNISTAHKQIINIREINYWDYFWPYCKQLTIRQGRCAYFFYHQHALNMYTLNFKKCWTFELNIYYFLT